MNLTDLGLEVKTLLSQILNEEIPANDMDLIETGLLDSLALVNLIMDLESHFLLSINFDALELEFFHGVASITAYLKTLLGSA